MIFYNIGDIVVPVVNIEVQGAEIPTAGTSGTVINREFISQPVEEGSDPIYDYQVQFPSPLQGESITVVSGEDVITLVTVEILWLTSSDLGIEEAVNPFLLDTAQAATDLSAAQQTSSTAVTVIEDAKNTMAATESLFDTVESISRLAGVNNSSLQNIDLAGAPNETYSTASRSSELLGYDQLIFQEVAENVSEMQAVIRESEQELKDNEAATQAANIAGSAAAEQDYAAYVNTVLKSPSAVNSFVPSTGTIEQFVYPEDEVEDNYDVSSVLQFLSPEEQATIVFDTED